MRPIIEVWPVQLQEALPIVPVPLADDDPDVALDLQSAFSGVYDAYRYDLSVDYARPPEVPLEGEDALWTDDVLRKAGVVTSPRQES